jgi:hypothetical protein
LRLDKISDAIRAQSLQFLKDETQQATKLVRCNSILYSLIFKAAVWAKSQTAALFCYPGRFARDKPGKSCKNKLAVLPLRN